MTQAILLLIWEVSITAAIATATALAVTRSSSAMEADHRQIPTRIATAVTISRIPITIRTSQYQ